MESEALLKHYMEIKAEISRLEEELEALKPAVFDVVSDAGGKIEFMGQEFQTQYRKTWEYTQDIRHFEDELKELKRKSEAEGSAIIRKMSGFVVMKAARSPK